jgi:adenosylcobinamide kinase/adenosylcobinamide-phosphate guanylyltransferase
MAAGPEDLQVRELILGGVRSGKSRLAEARAAASGCEVVYVATAEARDEGMRQRIRAHRERRPAGWRTIEADQRLATLLRTEAAPGRCLLVECLTLWLARLIEAPRQLHAETEALAYAVPRLPGELILVSNEVGLGVIPAGELSRHFVDQAGVLHQRLAGCCDRVTLVAAGLPMTLKGTLP